MPSKIDISNKISVSKQVVEKFVILYKPCMAKHTNSHKPWPKGFATAAKLSLLLFHSFICDCVKMEPIEKIKVFHCMYTETLLFGQKIYHFDESSQKFFS